MSYLYRFGAFALDPSRRALSRAGRSVPLTPKAFDLLLFLVQNSNRVISKDELLKALWAENFVEEGNLTQNVFLLRRALSENPEESGLIVTIPRKGYQFAAEVTVVEDASSIDGRAGQVLVTGVQSTTHIVIEEESVEEDGPARPGLMIEQARLLEIGQGDAGLALEKSRNVEYPKARARGADWKAIVGLSLAVLILAASSYWYFRRTSKLASSKFTERDTVVLSDFANATGDVVFDDTLKQALAIQLEQSPFLRVLSDSKVRSTLKLMNHPVSEHITLDIAREVCVRNNGKAVLEGSIGSVGNHYLIGIRALECDSGETLASAANEAKNRDGILSALGNAGNGLRGKLGESLASVEKFNKPLEQATTSSLEALKVYTLGQTAGVKGDENGSVVYFSRAIELDPNFARCYAALGSAYHNLQQPSRSIENYKKAYALRDRVSDRERFYIEANYYSHVTGEADKAIQTYNEWIQSYPQDLIPHFNLAVRYGAQGEYAKALVENLEASKLAPDDAGGYGTLMGLYLPLGRWEEARAVYDQAMARKMDSFVLRENRYDLAFLQNDTAVMQEQLAGAVGKAAEEDLLLSAQSDTEAYFGQFAKARDFSQQAMQSAMRAGSKEAAALWQAKAALREAEGGDWARARKEAKAALALGPGLAVEFTGGLALARAGDFAEAEKVVDRLDKGYPQGTIIQNFYLPSIRAAVRLNRNDSSGAIQVLEPAELYELGGNRSLYPAYLRGIAYLMAGKGQEAAAEFQKLQDHHGIVSNCILGALVHAQLGRAEAMAGDEEAARKSYEEFFALWKDADPDIPFLKQVTAEYATLIASGAKGKK